MRTRRLALRLLVAFITFYVGWAAAVLFGTTRVEEPYAPATHHELRLEAPPPPHFHLAPHGPCGPDMMPHVCEREWRKLHAIEAPPPPPPPRRPR